MDKVIAMYYRISLPDRNNPDSISNSIMSQRELLHNFALSKEEFADYQIIEYCDDGFSGTNFDRPQVQKMLSAAEHGHIQVIIVKDFSRFGRNSIEVGNYLEEIFPYTGLRFISVNDNYDSNDYFGDTGGFEISIKNLISQTYAQDASRKIKSNFEAKVRSGEFIPFKKIYGYITTADKKLIVDEAPARIVRRIFEMKREGKSYPEISKELNTEKILVPTLYFKYDSIDRNDSVKEMNLWNRTILSSIVNDERYTGKLIYGRYKSDKIRSKTFSRVPREKWIIVEGNHEAIISEDLFAEVQSKIKRKSESQKGRVCRESLFHSKVVCGCCGRAFGKFSYDKGTLSCMTPTLSGGEYECYRQYIYEKDIAIIIIESLKVFTLNYKPKQVSVQNIIVSMDDELRKINREIKSLKTKIATTDMKKEKLFQELVDRIIDDDGYVNKSEVLEKKQIILENELAALFAQKEKVEKEISKKEEFVATYNEIGTIKELTRDIVEKLIEKIIISKEGRIEIVWKFGDVFKI